MDPYVAVVDYGRGNLRSVTKALETVNIRVKVVRTPAILDEAAALVVPGQGAFDDCMETLDARGLLTAILRAIREGKPYLGICIGLQILYTYSEEHGIHQGLDLISGRVVRFPDSLSDSSSGKRLKIPHMGWNEVEQTDRTNPLWRNISDRSYFYFVHSYYGIPNEATFVAGRTEYGIPFASALLRDNLFAVQFHPEKSQKVGLTLLRNFGEWVGKEVLIS